MEAVQCFVTLFVICGIILLYKSHYLFDSNLKCEARGESFIDRLEEIRSDIYFMDHKLKFDNGLYSIHIVLPMNSNMFKKPYLDSLEWYSKHENLGQTFYKSCKVKPENNQYSI